MNTTSLFRWNKNPELFANVDPTKKVICINQGGTACFEGSTLVMTEKGLKKISEIDTSDNVLSYDIENNNNEYKKVIDVFKYKNTKPTVKIKLKNGNTIICTDDHLFFVGGAWISIKHLLSLWKLKYKDNETNTEF